MTASLLLLSFRADARNLSPDIFILGGEHKLIVHFVVSFLLSDSLRLRRTRLLRVQESGIKNFFGFRKILRQALFVRAAKKHFQHAPVFLDAKRKRIITEKCRLLGSIHRFEIKICRRAEIIFLVGQPFAR